MPFTRGYFALYLLAIVTITLPGCDAPDGSSKPHESADLASSRPLPPAPNRLKIVTYNVLSCRRGIDGIANLLRDQEPDVVFLQEVSCSAKDPRGIDQASYIANKIGGYHVASADALGFQNKPRWDQAILSRYELREARLLDKGDGGRSFGLIATVNASGRPLHLLCVHTNATFKFNLGHAIETSKARMGQVVDLLDLVAQLDGDVIIAGDFNATDWMPEYKAITRQWIDFGLVNTDAKLTIPSHYPLVRIDYVFGRGELEAISYEVLGAQLSDHRPVVTTLQRRGRKLSVPDRRR